MFLLKGKAFIEDLTKNSSFDYLYLKTLRNLKNDLYSFVYSYSSLSEMIIYEAYLKDFDQERKQYISFEVSSDGSPIDDLDSYQKALYVYLGQKELSLFEKSPDELEKIYAPILDELESLPEMEGDALLERAKTRAEFASIFSGEEESPFIKPSSLWTLMARVSVKGNSKILSLELWDGEQLKIPVASISTFLDAYQDEGSFEYRGKRYSLSKDLFSLKESGLLAYLSGSISSEVGPVGKELEISDAQFAKILEYLIGKIIILNGEETYISNQIQRAGFLYGERDEIRFVPSLGTLKSSKYIIAKNMILLLDENLGVITLYRFANRESKSLFVFFLNKTPREIDSVKDLIKERIPPYLSLNEQEEEEKEFNITLYVSLTNSGSLEFKSEYRLAGKKIDKSELMNDVEYEEKLENYLEALNRYGAVENGVQKDQSSVLRFLQSDLSSLKKVCDIMLDELIQSAPIRHVEGLSISLEHNTDWLSLRVKSKKFSYSDLDVILENYKKKKKFVLLHGEIILLDDTIVKELYILKTKERLNNSYEAVKLNTADAFRLSYLGESGHISFDRDEYLLSVYKSIQNFEDKEISLDSSLSDIMRPYQISAVKWLKSLYENGLGGILADDMGLGKSLESIAFLSLLKEEKPTMVIAPKSVIYNWENEIKKWTPKAKVTVIEGSKEKRLSIISSIKNDEKAIYIASYDSIRNDLNAYSKKKFDVLFADEAQTIKNYKALKSQAIKSIKSNAKFALTGTPIENSMGDLWSIFDFLMPGYLDTFYTFKTRYIMAGDQTKARNDLRRRTALFILRRTKSEVLKELPPKSEETITISMNEEELKIYNATLEKARTEFLTRKEATRKERASMSAFYILPFITNLREICVDGPAFMDGFEELSSKISFTVDYIVKAISSSHKVLVFSSFTKVLEDLRSVLKNNGVPSYYIHGAVDAKKRLEDASKFNNDNDVSVMLVSLKAGGTGLNLNGADIVIHLDPWWNLASENQATDRAYRLGQKRPVSVLKLVCHNSIEEKVIALQQSKKDLYESIIKSGESAISSLTEEDIKFLLS